MTIVKLHNYDIYKYQGRIVLKLYIGRVDLKKYPNITEIFNNFINNILFSKIQYNNYNIMITLAHTSSGLYKYISSYWKGMSYNIVLPHIPQEIIEREIVKNNILMDKFNNYYVRQYIDNRTGNIKIYINFIGIKKIYEDMEEIINNEVIKLNKYIKCENVNCSNMCNNKNIVKSQTGDMFYRDTVRTIGKLEVKNTKCFRQMYEIPLCKECNYKLKDTDCYLCLEKLTGNITYICENIQHSVHSSCYIDNEKSVIKNVDGVNLADNLKSIVQCGYCRKNSGKYFNLYRYKLANNIVEPDDITRSEVYLTTERIIEILNLVRYI